jgi:hypothetical protein
MPLLLYFATSGAFLFGYAKPVPVNFGHLRNPKRDMIWVALAGPASNFVQAIALGHSVHRAGGHGGAGTLLPGDGQGRRAGQPGDVGFQPVSAAAAGRRAHPGGPAALAQAQLVSRVEPWGFFIVMGLVIAGVVGTYWLRPLMAWATPPSTCCSPP